tara:strand:- start:135 stop:338 length:204 start_codon:yes stop_codon:yes gene_type:complete
MNTLELLGKIKTDLQSRRQAIAEKMISGRISDIASYQKDVGLAQGLDIACTIIDETLQKINEEDVDT